MTNLIPPQARNILVKEYWKRVITVWLFLIICTLLIIGTLLYPTYELIKSQQVLYSEAYSEVQSKTNTLREIKKELKESESIAKLLVDNTSTENISYFEILQVLDELSGDMVQVSQVTISEKEDVGKTARIVGIADTRISLANFREKIQDHKLFKSAEYSLSDIAKSTDINFNINVVLDLGDSNSKI